MAAVAEEPRAGSDAASEGPSRRSLPGWAPEAAWALAAAAVSLLVAVWVLRLWDGWAPSRPLNYDWDAFYYQGIVKGVLEHGWYLHNPDIGTPAGLDSHDFPVVSNDALQLLIISALGILFSSVFTVVNVFFLLTFPLAALTAFWAMRRLGASRGPALVGAVLFATTPYHFLKGETQLFFASYYLVPLSCLLALRVMAGEPLFARRAAASGLRAWASRRSLAVLALCVLIASASIYYAVFTMLLVGVAALLQAVAAGRVRAVATGAVIVAAIGAVVVLEQAPSLLYRADRGPNPGVAARTGADTEFFALKLDQMVFPVYGHRIDGLARFTDDYRLTTRMLGEPTSYLGALGTIGLVWLLVVGVAAVAGGRLGTLRERHAAAATLVAFLFATAGGVSAVIGYALSAQIRTWSRMSIFIAFLALLALALLLERLSARAGPRRARAVAVGLAVLLAIGVVEQTSPRFAPDHDAIAATMASDAGFVHLIERRLPPGSQVLQLPYAPYPENPTVFGGGDYVHMRAYLHSSSLRWSYGAMKGRPEDWHATLEELPLRPLLDGVAAAGFGGVYVDRRGYGDRGAALQGELTRRLGEPAATSADGNLAFWDLRDYAGRIEAGRRPAMAAATVTPVQVRYGPGVYEREGGAEGRWRWADERAEITLENPHRDARRMLLDVVLRTDAEQPGRTTVRFPDGSSRTVTIDTEGTRVRRSFAAPPGRSVVRLDTVGTQVPIPPEDQRRFFVQLRDGVLMPEVLCARPVPACTAAPRPQLR